MTTTMRLPIIMRWLRETSRRLSTTAMSIGGRASIPFMEPMHFLGSGSIGLLFASQIRMSFPAFPLRMLLRPAHEPRLATSPPPMLDVSNDSSSMSNGSRRRRRRYMEVCLQRSSSSSNGRPCVVHLPAEIIEEASSNIHTASTTKIRNLILATKAPDAAMAVRSIVNRLDANARIIILCNGALAVREEVYAILKDCQLEEIAIHLASTTHGAYQDKDDTNSELYHVVHAGIGKTYIEELPSMASLWDRAGLVAESISKREMNILLWHKLAANCVINPLTALLQCTNGQLLDKDEFRNMSVPILEELAAVSMESARQCNEQDVDQLSVPALLSFVQDVITDTAQNKSSMLQDVLNGKPTEIEYLNGYVVRKGKEYGLDVTANLDICGRVEELTRDYSQ